MTAYVVLEFDDDLDAADLYYEMAADPNRPIKTPMGHTVRARVVYHGATNPIHDECDGGDRP